MMTDRERWTVYPLLFLALGAALKDKLTKAVDTEQVNCRQINCRQVNVVDRDDKPMVQLSTTKSGGAVSAVGYDKQVQRVVIGHVENNNGGYASGLFLLDERGNALPLTQLIRQPRQDGAQRAPVEAEAGTKAPAGETAKPAAE